MQSKKEAIAWLITVIMGTVLGIGNLVLYCYALGFLFSNKFGINGFIGVVGYIALNVVIIGIVTGILNWSMRRD